MKMKGSVLWFDVVEYASVDSESNFEPWADTYEVSMVGYEREDGFFSLDEYEWGRN